MGLGKTVQTVSLVRMAKERYGVKFPALIVAPLSTIAHWQREFQHWTNLDVMVYHGSARGREAARRTDVQVRNDRKGIAVDVVITTYEQLLLDDTAPLGRSKWGVVVVDEAHRLKNPQSRLYRALNGSEAKFPAAFRVLLTGTPLQNNMTELWALLSFCSPNFGHDPDEFVEKHRRPRGTRSALFLRGDDAHSRSPPPQKSHLEDAPSRIVPSRRVAAAAARYRDPEDEGSRRRRGQRRGSFPWRR